MAFSLTWVILHPSCHRAHGPGDPPGARGPGRGRRQLVIEDFGAAYGQPGQLDLGQIEAGFRAAGRQARADGFGGLRVAAEMGDFARAIGSVERLLDWERSCTPMLDLASRAVFGRVLRARLAVLYQAASGLNGDGCIRLTRAPAQLRRIIDLAGLGHPRVVID